MNGLRRIKPPDEIAPCKTARVRQSVKPQLERMNERDWTTVLVGPMGGGEAMPRVRRATLRPQEPGGAEHRHRRAGRQRWAHRPPLPPRQGCVKQPRQIWESKRDEAPLVASLE